MAEILIVEDNELNIKLFKDILEYQSHNVTIATDGLIAYDKIKNKVFDLILLDIQLPKMSGFDLINKLQKEKINIPKVIAVSACAMDEDKARAKALNINDYITKPIDINNFLKVINSSL